MFCFVLAYGESDFQLYRETRSELIPLFLCPHHINYAQWLPVHLRDMLALEQIVYILMYIQNTTGRFFSIRKLKKAFSMIAIDQAHEQNNAVIKSMNFSLSH